MKIGYKRLLVFIISIMIILLLNSFYFNILSNYKIVLMLVILLVFFQVYFVLEKDRHLYVRDVIIEEILFIMGFFIFYYLLGLLVGLTKVQSYLSITGIVEIVIPIILYSILRELLRYNMLCKADGNKLCTIFVILLFILFDITNSVTIASFTTNYKLLRFGSLILFPAIATNIAYSYISKEVGYKPIIFFDLIYKLYPYIVLIVPAPSEYLKSIIYLVVPILLALKVYKFLNQKNDEIIPRNYYKKRFKSNFIPIIIIIILVYFYSGYFRFYAIAIATGSMSPGIRRGDIVIIDKKDKKIKESDIIAYKKVQTIIVHRIIQKIRLKDTYIYYTKGDANNNKDDFVIEEDMILGKVKYKIPFIGYPTILFNKD